MRAVLLVACFLISSVATGELTNDPMSVVKSFFEEVDKPVGTTNSPNLFVEGEAQDFATETKTPTCGPISNTLAQQKVIDYYRRARRMFACPRATATDFWNHSAKWRMIRDASQTPSDTSRLATICLTGEWKFSGRVFKDIRINLTNTPDGWKIYPMGIYINGVGVSADDGSFDLARWNLRVMFQTSTSVAPFQVSPKVRRQNTK